MNNATKPAAHTPTPWIQGVPSRGAYQKTSPDKLWQVGLEAESNPDDLKAVYGPDVAVAFGPTQAIAEANAALIVRAVNSHAELVTALERIVSDSLLMPVNQSPQIIADFNASLVITARSIARAARTVAGD